jgi:hypothetical protein
MAAKRRKSIETKTTRTSEGFFEPFNIDAVPWRKLAV